MRDYLFKDAIEGIDRIISEYKNVIYRGRAYDVVAIKNKIANLRAAARVLRACGIWSEKSDFAPLHRAILNARRIYEANRKRVTKSEATRHDSWGVK